MEEERTVFLADGSKIFLEDDERILSVDSDGRIRNTFEIRYPSGGYGGGSLMLSPSENYVIFSYYSGQSEEAFSLFQIENGEINFLFDSGYLYGEQADYSFAHDEAVLVQILRTGTWYVENAETDENGDWYYDFGELNFFNLEAQEFSRHTIRVYPVDDWEEEKTDAGVFAVSEINSGKIVLTVPWGRLVFCEPLDKLLIVRPK